MENPKTWNAVQKTIYEALLEHDAAEKAGLLGLSVVSRIYFKLKAGGFLKEEGN